ncbi:hypothetical protein C8J57DRAFT_1457113 [Mycena rebaudengoi]|nr:hypothetical protein C8J57DRAFT_1457113 [Mycena rebaudengoi]
MLNSETKLLRLNSQYIPKWPSLVATVLPPPPPPTAATLSGRVSTTTPATAPSQTADALGGWESDASQATVDTDGATPTPQAARPSTPPSVEDFPPLSPVTPTPTAAAKAPSKSKAKGKKKAVEEPARSEDEDPSVVVDKPAKGKGKKKAAAGRVQLQHRPSLLTPLPVRADKDDPTLARDLAKAKAASMGLTLAHAVSDDGASSSRRPPDTPDSPSKRMRSNTAGESAPAPFTITTPAAAPAPVVESAPTTAESPFLAPMGAPAAANTDNIAADDTAAVATNNTPAAAPNNAMYAAVAAAAPVAAAAAAAAALPPLWLTADGLPPRGAYTPTPAGGLPLVWYSPELLLQGMPPALLQLHEEVNHPKLYLVLFPWHPADRPQRLYSTHPAVSSSDITFFPIPFGIPNVGFVGVFDGFTLPNTTDGADMARDLIRAAIAADNNITQFVQTHRDAFGPQTSAGEALETFLASVAVRSLVLVDNGTSTVNWRLHVNPPTSSRDSWAQLRRLFGRLQIMTARFGCAHLRRSFRCRICPSIDHPTPLCPFPNVPGWLGPTPATIAAIEEAGRAAAAKAQDRNSFAPAGGSHANGRSQGNKKPFDGKGKKGGDFKGKVQYKSSSLRNRSLSSARYYGATDPPGSREGLGEQAHPPRQCPQATRYNYESSGSRGDRGPSPGYSQRDPPRGSSTVALAAAETGEERQHHRARASTS